MRILVAALILCHAALIICSCSIVSAHAQSGIASVYGGRDGYCGRHVAGGGTLHCDAMTAAACALNGCDAPRPSWLPFNALVKVTIAGGNYIIVHINDRGPFVKGRIIDLTPAAARALGCHDLCHVTIEALR